MYLNKTLSVSELNKLTKDLLETHFLTVEVSGEISGFVKAASGHWYFTLKDQRAQVKCAMFRGQNRGIIKPPKNGDQVRIKARVTLYEGRGDFQLVANALIQDGAGALMAAYEQLKNKLNAEGLFETQYKKHLPLHAKTIGVITSPTGAAIQDILQITARRYPLAQIKVYPCQVQGAEAPKQIQNALHCAIQRNECDVLIIGRGGGSIEDLWAFNDETLARLIFHCPIPIISAVGHEIDFTICDWVADVRAATPSAAAELVTPDQYELKTRFESLNRRLTYSIQQSIYQKQQQLKISQSKLIHPKHKIEQSAQKLDELVMRLQQSTERHLQELKFRLNLQQQKLSLFHPEKQLLILKDQHTHWHERLILAMKQYLDNQRQALANQARNLNLVSPLNILDRGYSITQNQTGLAITSAQQVSSDETLNVRLHQGQIKVKVIEKSE